MDQWGKNLTITGSSIAGLIITYVSVINTGVLDDLNLDKFLTYTIPQFIFLVLLGIGVGMIFGQVLGKGKNTKDAVREIDTMLKQTLNLNDKELKRFYGDLKNQGKSAADQTLNKIKTKINTVFLGDGELPTPDELRSLIYTQIRGQSVNSISVLAVDTEEKNVGSSEFGAKIPIIPAQSFSESNFTEYNTQIKRKLIIAVIILVISIILYFFLKGGF